MLAVQPQAPTTTIISPDFRPQIDPHQWLSYFNPAAAVQSVIDHVETLPGSRHERHTMRAYLSSLADYVRFLGASVKHNGGGEDYTWLFDRMQQPTAANTQQYIAHCRRIGLTSKTIIRYMASVRLFFKALKAQPVVPQSGGDFLFIMETLRQFDLSIAVKNPPPDFTSNRPALEQHGTRLTLSQVNQLFDSFSASVNTLTGKRDLAILYLGITSGLRAAEIARITPNSIHQGDNCYEIRVRGKRANHDPIGIDATAHQLIQDWITAYNHAAGDNVIVDDVPVFQPLRSHHHLVPGHDPARGMTQRSINRLVERVTQRVLGIKIGAHDMRRTCAYLLRSEGFDWDAIQGQLRHKSIATTQLYVGKPNDLSKSLLSNRVDFTIPKPDMQLDMFPEMVQ